MSAIPVRYRDPYYVPPPGRHVASLLGDLELVTAPSGSVELVSEAKRHLRVEQAADDTYIGALVAAATRYVEQEIDGHRQLLTATYKVPVRDWWCGPLRLPRPPLQSVGSVKYYATDGTLTTLASTYYLVRTPMRAPGTVERAPQQVWPAYQCDRRFPVEVTFTCGYGAAANVPETLKQAIALLVGHWYLNREAVVTGTISKEVEFAVCALCQTEGWGSYS